MSLIISLLVMTALAAAIRVPLGRLPLLFYGLACAVSVAGIYLTLFTHPHALIRAFAFAVQKGHLGFSLFAVVMYIGVFDARSPIRRFFNPVRAELSIIAAILIAGHFILYLRTYLVLMGDIFSLRWSILTALAIALILLTLLIVLTVSSFNAVKRKMRPATWKKLQKLAYLFFGLVYLHLLGYLLPPALSGSVTAMTNVAVYSVLFGAYAVLRVRKALRERRLRARELLKSAHLPLKDVFLLF
jgi:DMSO/TMAO reductase YedYZ heme-binding membrane subunit